MACHLSLAWRYVLVFVISLFSMAFGPALNATLPRLVKKDQLIGINALMQSALTVGQLFGLALSGILIAVIGAQNVLYVNAGAFLISALFIFPLKIPHVEAAGRRGAWSNAMKDFQDGLRFILSAALVVAHGHRVGLLIRSHRIRILTPYDR